LHVLKSYSTKK